MFTWFDCVMLMQQRQRHGNNLCDSNHIKVTVSWLVKNGLANYGVNMAGIFDLQVVSWLSMESQNHLATTAQHKLWW